MTHTTSKRVPLSRTMEGAMTLRARGSLPSFTVKDLVSGELVNYHDDVWQHRMLVLVVVAPDYTARSEWLQKLGTDRELQQDARLVATTDRVDGASPFTVAVADRWGEIYWVRHAATESELPSVDEVLDWVQYVRQECPECQGETR